jgi:hypothetical protein
MDEETMHLYGKYNMEGIMVSRKKNFRFIVGLGVALLQLIMTQFVTFLITLPFPDMENFPQTHSVVFVILLCISFTIGVFYTGWVAIKLGRLPLKPKLRSRLIFTLIGAAIPLILALVLYHPLEPGNPFFFVSMLTSVVGFYVPEWIRRG